jgi:hypothetical protein
MIIGKGLRTWWRECAVLSAGRCSTTSRWQRPKSRRRLVVGVALCLLGVGAAWFMGLLDSQPQNLRYGPAGSDNEAKSLLASVLATNTPWLDPETIWGKYSLRYTSKRCSLTEAYRNRSLRPLYESNVRKQGPFLLSAATPRSRRTGAGLWTPLHTLLAKYQAPAAVRLVGKTRWRGKQVIALDVAFEVPVQWGYFRSSDGDFPPRDPFRFARIVVDAGTFVPVFIGTWGASTFQAKPPFERTWVFPSGFFGVDGGRAPRLVVECHQGGSCETEFQVINGAWILKRVGGSGRPVSLSGTNVIARDVGWCIENVELVDLRFK